MRSYDNNAVHPCAGHSCVLCRRICDNIDGACAVAKLHNNVDSAITLAASALAAITLAAITLAASAASAASAGADAGADAGTNAGTDAGAALTAFNRWLQRQANGGRDRGGCCGCRSTADDYANVRCWMTSLQSSLHRMMSVCNASWPLRSTLNLGVQFTPMM